VDLLGIFMLPALVVIGIFMVQWVRILTEYERGVVFRLGRVVPEPVGPGFVLLVAPPFVDQMVKIDMRTVAMDVPSQDVITRDNISVKVNAVLYYRVIDPIRAVLEVEDFAYATSQISQTTLRSIIGQVEMDELLAHRDKLSHKIQEVIDEQTEPWGIKVINVEIKNVDIPADMQRALARQAEAERERRAKIIAAEGEFQAAEKLVGAASMMEDHPMALQMRYLQTLMELGTSGKATTIVFPIPMDIMGAVSSILNHTVAGQGPSAATTVVPVSPDPGAY
jgi:regulator of protease activity HflC (stomatin/prohibitin superfamily)